MGKVIYCDFLRSVRDEAIQKIEEAVYAIDRDFDSLDTGNVKTDMDVAIDDLIDYHNQLIDEKDKWADCKYWK